MKPLPKLLSKTKIMRGYRCLKAIHLTIHSPELEPPIGPDQQAVFDQGNRVGEVARTYYPGGVLVDNKPWDFGGSLKRTRELLKDGTEFIYEAAFEYKGCYARADILKFSTATGRWTLIEVKSSTKVKPEHLEDVGLQAWIIANSGLHLEKICVLHLNPECRFPDLSNLFVEVEVTDQLRENYREITPKLNAIFSAIRQPQAPETDIGPHCSLNRACEFKPVCFGQKGIPEVSIFSLPRLGDKVWEFYKKGQVELKDIDPSELNEIQQRMVRAHMSGKAFIDKDGIRAAMKEWKYPLVFLDFETINPPIPCYPGCAPYQQVPFQFSVHIQREAGGTLEHKEFLHDNGSDPRPALIPALLEACGEEGSIVSYFATFEKKRIEEMAEFSDEFRAPLEALLPRFVDPLTVIRDSVYDIGFAGSFSLKAVAPALLGDALSYEGMTVADGGGAQRAFTELINAGTSEFRRDEIKRDLLQYCEQDTLAMVEAVKWLYSAQ